jgi:hypothetical protein
MKTAPYILLDHNWIKVDFKNKIKYRKHLNTWKTNGSLKKNKVSRILWKWKYKLQNFWKNSEGTAVIAMIAYIKNHREEFQDGG